MSERQTERRTWFVSLRLKFLVGFTLLFSIVFTVAFYWFYSFATEQVMARVQDNMVATLNGAIAGVDGDEFIALAREGIPREDGLTDDPRYWRHLAWLETVHNIEPRAYPYTYVKGDEPQEVLFIGDILVITNREKSSAFRESYISKGGMWGGLTGPNLKMDPYVDPWGSWVSAYAPIKDSNGELVGGMGVDFPADYVHQVRRAILDDALIAFVITYVMLFVLVFLISGALTRATLALTQTAGQVAQGDYDQDIRGLYSGRLRDEISSLAQVFDSMVSNIARDITERKQAEEALRKSEERYRSLFDGVPVGLYRSTPEGQILDANPALVRILDYPDQESYLAVNAADMYVNPEDRVRWQALMEREGMARDFEHQVRRYYGTAIWVKDTTRAVQDADGRVLYYEGALEDITERKKAEEELRDREATMRALLNAPIDMATLLDADGIIIDANEATARSLGRNLNELVGLCVYDFLSPAVAKSRKAQIDRVFRSGSPVRFEDELEGKFFDCNLYPVLDAKGKVARIAAYARDITLRKQADERIRAYQERLRSLTSQLSLTEERERREIATALHDGIGQTLAICKMQLGMLQQSASSTELAESLDEIQKHIQDIIRDTRSLTLEISSPMLYQLGLEAAVEWLTEQTQDRYGIASVFRDDGQPKPLDDDVRVLVFQSVRELLLNVAKHAQAQGVQVAIRRDNNDIQIIVEDDGVGFDVFPTGSHWSAIKGFGLFSIRERLDHLGGQLKIKSKPGHGTQVILVTPLKREETP